MCCVVVPSSSGVVISCTVPSLHWYTYVCVSVPTCKQRMDEHGIVPSIVHANSLSQVLLDEVQDVEHRAYVLFSACPHQSMTLTGEAIGKLTSDVRSAGL